MTLTTGTHPEDPVAVSIQDYLQREAAHGHGPLQIREHPDGVTVRFGQTAASGETVDIAFIRLARQLMDDERFSESLIDCLRGLHHV